MTARTPIDPLAQQVMKFVVDFYAPRLIRFVRRNLSMKAIGWVAVAGAVIILPFAVAAVLKSNNERASNKRYDTADYLSDDLA